MKDQPNSAHHRWRYWGTEIPPSLSRMPVTIDTGIRLGNIARIELHTDRVHVYRRLFGDWEEPYGSFRHLSCRELSTDDPLVNSSYGLRLIHFRRRKSIFLYEFVNPRFDVSEFARTLSQIMKLSLQWSEKFVKAHW